jgi:hypothetical protein
MHHDSRGFAVTTKPVCAKLLWGAVVVLDSLDCRFVRSLLSRKGYFRITAGGHMPVALPDANACTSWVVRTGKRGQATARHNAEQIDCAAPEMRALQETI